MIAPRISTILNRASIVTVAYCAHQFGQWWLRELLTLLPNHFSQWLVGPNQKTVSILTWDGKVEIQLRLNNDNFESITFDQRNFSTAALSDFLRKHKLAIEDVKIGIRFPLAKFFERTLILPIEAAQSIDAILAQDLTRKTPFKLADIYSDYRGNNDLHKNKITISQWIIRRDLVDRVVHSLGLSLEAITFIEADSKSERTNRIPIINPRKIESKQKWPRMATFGLSFSAALLIIIFVGIKFWQQQSALDALDAQLAAITPKAQKVRTAINKLEDEQSLLTRLRTKKTSEPSLTEIWNEATRVLPLHSWLTELRFSENSDGQSKLLTINGFSTAATSLVGIFDASPLFIDAALTAPIAIDQTEGRERFAMQIKIKALSSAQNK
jgi:general secretion pathway protein L